MVNVEIDTIFQDLSYKIVNPNLKERKQVFRALIEILETCDLDEYKVKIICSQLPSTISCYKERSSRLLVNDLIYCLLDKYPQISIKCLSHMVRSLAKHYERFITSKSSARLALQILHWSTVIFNEGWRKDPDLIQKHLSEILQSQSQLLTNIVAIGDRKQSQIAANILDHSWKQVENSEKLYLDMLKESEQSSYSVVLAAFIARRLTQIKRDELLDDYLNLFIDGFIKNFINTKTKPSSNIIVATYPLLQRINHDLFKTNLLPALQKAMLRNPEIILEGVGLIIGGVVLDLSPFALDIGNSFIANLRSNDEQARINSIECCKILSTKINQSDAIDKLLTRTFSIFHGVEGKLTVIDHKLSLLNGAGNFSYNNVKCDLDKLLLKASDLFIKVLNEEVHEKILCHTLDMFQLWLMKYLQNDIPKKIIDAFKNGFNLKTSTPLVRIAYLKCILICLNEKTIKQSSILLPNLIKSIENAIKQSTQILILTEGLLAAIILLKLNTEQEARNNEFNNIWNTLLDMDKQVFVAEKFVSTIDENEIIYILMYCEELSTKYLKKLKGNPQRLYRTILRCATHKTTKIRQQCLKQIKNFIRNDPKLIEHLLKELQNFLKITKVDDNNNNNNDENMIDIITPQSLINCLTTLCSQNDCYDPNDRNSILLEAFLPTHHPNIRTKSPDLWLKIIKYFKLNPQQLVEENFNYFHRLLIDQYTIIGMYENGLSTISLLTPNLIIPHVIETVTKQLNDPDIINITKDEYFTYLTPPGELYDKSVIPGEEDQHQINLKRESKVYSYKEQLEELQLRRELEEKRKKDGKLQQQTPQYTQKQLELIKNQKIKEQEIRNRLNDLNRILLNCISMVQSSSNGNPKVFSLYFKKLLPSIINCLKSPLAAPHLTKLFINLNRLIFDKTTLIGEMIGFITLRLIQPQCDLESNWEQEDLTEAMLRIVSIIHEKIQLEQHYFTIPTCCYMFYLLKSCLLSNYAKSHDDVIHQCLQIISKFTELTKRYNDLEIYQARYLPVQQLFELLLDLISMTSGTVQTQTVNCLLDVATCIGDDSTGIGSDEIDVLLSALRNPLIVVRDAALRCLITIQSSLLHYKDNPGYLLKLIKRIWIIRFDDNEEICNLAMNLWNLLDLTITIDLCDQLLDDIEHPVESVQMATAKALTTILKDHPDYVRNIIEKLLKLYKERLKMIPAKLDEFGRELEKPIDTWYPRRGVAFALNELACIITSELIGDLIEFFVSTSLGDRHYEVRKEMLNAALKIVNLHGKETVSTLWPVFDNFMGKSSKQAHFDAVKQAVIVLMGSLARHLDKDDERIKPIFLRLIQALSTPSQTVQEAVSNCLPPLVQSVKEEAPGYINKLLHQLLKSDKYGERRGAAYGLAGMVKGLGILALKQHDIMTKLIDAIQDKKNYKHREGALFAFEMLFHMLGKLFEPYIIHVLPHLLQCFGDTSQYVRAAADDTAKVVMSKLSGHGVKLVLPSLLDALEQDSWRTKTGSVELLGAMAYCAPKQLSSCLPSIVPKLIEVLSDSHIKVQEAGADALKVIGSVIRNPEIQAIVPVLLKALQDPSNKTQICLQTLLDTQFVHFIDAPSLALIMPVVQRAFMDRSTETRKMAAQIIGNMYSLTDQKDLLPYLPTIIPGLKCSLLDPVPEVRSVSARALGAMVRGMGESSFEDLLPWLMQTLTSETSSVDRSGAAQGLSEVVGGLGVEKLHKLMPEIIATSERTDIAPHVKDGYIMMFIYMPVVFTTEFTPYIGQIINPILKALADENEYVRDTALKAGQRIVTLYADSAILLLLPQLEAGLFDANWRIRYSSVQLLGDLLYRISGVTGKMSTETASEDDNFGTEQSHHAIIRALGAERRNRVLAGLYMGRSDVALMVRQAALHVWKVVVTNTPRTLREILPTLFGLLLGCLASESYDKRQVAARTLGDLVRKLGERVLPEIIPILERGLQSDQPDQRQGVCIGLSEIMTSTSREMVLTFVNSLVPTVRKALCDPLPEVRHAAAKTFDSLHSTVGARALDDILPTLLNQLNDDNVEIVEWTLDGLRQVMAIKSRVVLPYLVPQLTAPPPNTKALSILASVAGEALNKYLPKILPALQMALATSRGTADEQQQLDYCQAVVLSVTDEIGIRTIIDILLENTRNENCDQRRAAASLLCGFCANSRAQYTAYIPQLLRGLIHLCSDNDKDILQMSWEALNAVTKTLEPKQQATYVQDVRQAVRYAMSDIKDADLLPGFCLPKGIAPILPIFREAILNGDGDEKEIAAQGLGEIIKVTSPQALQPSVVAITGPLIRILGDRFNANVKTAVLETLAILLAKVGIMLKQFLPQLQTTFVKALNDPNRLVRLKSATALSHLIVIHQRTDPLFTELHNTIKNTDDSNIRETTLHALRGIITPAGDKISDPVRKQIHTTLVMLLNHQEDVTRTCAAGCLGALCKWLTMEQLDCTLNEHLLVVANDEQIEWTVKHGRGVALSVLLKESPQTLWQDQYKQQLIQTILRLLSSDKVVITQSGIRCAGYLLQYLMMNQFDLPNTLLVPFTRTMNNNSNDVKQLLARVAIHLAKTVPQEKMSSDLLRLLLPTLVNGTKEKNSYVKANSELALIAVLKLREGDTMHQRCLEMLDIGARESLTDVVTKVLKKIMPQSDVKEEELDETLLT